MSLSVFFSGSLHQLVNNLGSNSTIKFLKHQYCTWKQFHVWRYKLKNSALVNEARLGLQSSIASCSNPLSNLQNKLGAVRAGSNKTTRLKSRKLSTNRATPCQIEKLIVRESTKNKKNQPEPFQPKTVNCYGFQQSTSVRKAVDWPATILVCDIETTGFGREKERIIEFALRDLIGGKDSTFETLVNPDKKEVSNTRVHGIRNDMVDRPDVPMFRELVPILLQYVRSRQMPGKPVLLVFHNGRRFDVPFINNEFRRCSMDIPKDWRFLDSLILARQLVMPDECKTTLQWGSPDLLFCRRKSCRLRSNHERKASIRPRTKIAAPWMFSNDLCSLRQPGGSTNLSDLSSFLLSLDEAAKASNPLEALDAPPF